MDPANPLITAAGLAEREECAKIAEGHSNGVEVASPDTCKELDGQCGLTYTMGYGIASSRIARDIRARGNP